MSAETDYPRQIKAWRISLILLVFIQGVSALGMPFKINYYRQAFSSNMDGGTDAMPLLTRLLMNNQSALVTMSILVMIGSICALWRCRRLSTLIYLAGAVTAFFALLSTLIEFGMHQAFITGLTKFQG